MSHCVPTAILRLLAATLLSAALACDGDPPGTPDGGEAEAPAAEAPGAEDAGERRGPPHAHWDVVDAMREDLAAERHPRDGGGRAWLERGPDQAPFAVAKTPDRFRLVYEVGPRGIARRGVIFFTPSPFWGWSQPQAEHPDAPGYTVVEASADDVELRVEGLVDQSLLIANAGRPLEPGLRITVDYGAGPLGAMTDRYAEASSRFWFAVDGDGDGVRATLEDSPAIEIRPREASQMRITLPTTARPGEALRVVVALLDPLGSAGVDATGEIEFVDVPEGLEMPKRVALTADDGGAVSIPARAGEPGVYRLQAKGPGDLRAESNPLVVGDGPRILWGDLHGHTAVSDGTGTPEDYFRYARDVSALDVISLTDHDHWGILHMDQHPELFDGIREAVRRFHEPGRFVTLLGYEWTSWIHGHRHVLWFDDYADAAVVSSIEEATDHPTELWEALEGQAALTIAHHSAGGPIPIDWSVPPDPRFEPVTEIVSVHGSSEAMDSPGLIYSPVPGNFVRDVLDRGYVFGFVGSGDSHDGHPGFAQLAAVTGGLAAILAEDATREAVREALVERRVYATSGPRILLRAALGGAPMGAAVAASPEDEGEGRALFVHVVAPEPLERVDLVRSGAVVDALGLEGRREVMLERPIEGLRAGEYLYVRVVQEDGGAAWSSPFFVTDTGEEPTPPRPEAPSG